MEKGKLSCYLLLFFILFINDIEATCVVERQIAEVKLTDIMWDDDYYDDSDDEVDTKVTYEYGISCNNSVLNSELSLQPQTTEDHQEEASKANNIRIKNSTLSKISKTLFKDFNSVERLLLVNSSISSIEPEALNMPNLITLQLSNNELTEIKEGTINKLSKLGELYLDHNQINSFESFQNCTNLWIIKLDYNNITTINDSHFQNLLRLRILQLNNNKISTIHPNAFSHSSDININLQYNNLETLPENLFQTFKNLNLSHNHLKELTFPTNSEPIYYFRYVFLFLKSVDLSYNDLTSVPKNLNYINRFPTNLNLGDNNIKTISAQDFAGVNQTINLNLSRNQIDTIEIGSFKDLPQLRSLDLSFNKIKELKPGVFTGLNQLRTLNLSHNEFIHFDSSVFYTMESVTEINFSGNYLHSLNTSEIHFQDLRFISLDFYHISCHTLTQYLHAFASHHITVQKGTTFDSENVQGIACDHRTKLNHTTTTTTTTTTAAPVSTTSATTPSTTTTTTPSTTKSATTTTTITSWPLTGDQTNLPPTSFDSPLKSPDVIATKSSHTVLITMIVLTLALGTGVGVWFGRKYYLNRYKNNDTESQYGLVNEIQM